MEVSPGAATARRAVSWAVLGWISWKLVGSSSNIDAGFRGGNVAGLIARRAGQARLDAKGA